MPVPRPSPGISPGAQSPPPPPSNLCAELSVQSGAVEGEPESTGLSKVLGTGKACASVGIPTKSFCSQSSICVLCPWAVHVRGGHPPLDQPSLSLSPGVGAVGPRLVRSTRTTPLSAPGTSRTGPKPGRSESLLGDPPSQLLKSARRLSVSGKQTKCAALYTELVPFDPQGQLVFHAFYLRVFVS